MEAGQALRQQEVDEAIKILSEKAEYPAFLLYAQKVDRDVFRKFQSLGEDAFKGRKIDADALCELIAELVFLMDLATVYRIPVTMPTLWVLQEHFEVNIKSSVQLFMIYDVSHFIAASTPPGEDILRQSVDFLQHLLQNKFEGWHDNTLMANFLIAANTASKSKPKQGENNYTRHLCSSTLMQETSMLIAIESMSFVSDLRTNNKHYQLLVKYIDNEMSLMRDYEAMKQRQASDEDIQNTCQLLEKNTKDFFYELGEPISVEASNAFEPVDTYELCFLLRKCAKPFNYGQIEKEVIEEPQPEPGADNKQVVVEQLEFFVMFSSERESLEVQLYSDLQVTAERSDFLSVQVAQFSFREGNVNMEISDRVSSGNLKARFLTYRAHSCFINKQPLLQKILIVVDTLMIVKMLTEKYFSGSAVQLDMESTHKKVAHYLGILNDLHDQLIEKLPKKRLQGREF